MTLNQLLRNVHRDLSLSAQHDIATLLYIADPLFPDQLTMVSSVGLRYPETMAGLMSLPTSLETAHNDTQSPWSTHSPTVAHNSLDRLFADFISREHISTSLRVCIPSHPRTFLYILFRGSVAERDSLDSLAHYHIVSIHQRVAKLYPHLITRTHPDTRRALTVLGAIDTYAREAHGTTSQSHTKDAFLVTLLTTLLNELRLTPETSLGTIHRFDPETNSLTLAAAIPDLPECPRSQSVTNREGVLSWVAHTQSAIYISDITDKRFSLLHITFADGMKSEIAVPMLFGNELVGVINLESRLPHRFGSRDVRTISYIASRAAVALVLGRASLQAEQLTGLIRDLSIRIKNPDGWGARGMNTLSHLARAMQASANADKCDLWLRTASGEPFEAAGSTYDVSDTSIRPRMDGWSTHISQCGNPLWIEGIGVDSSRYKASEWLSESESWSDIAITPRRNLSTRLAELGVQCELGIPISDGSTCIGVAWIKYNQPRTRPTAGHLLQIQAYTSTVGMLLSVVKPLEDARQKFDSYASQFREDLFQHSLPESARFDIHVISNPYESAIGGDFHNYFAIDSECNRIAIIIGDGEGHGYEGAFHMLPLFTACSLWRSLKTTSTQFVLQSVAAAAHEMKARGTAMLIMIDAGDTWTSPVVSGTTAGHPAAIILSPNGTNSDFPPATGDTNLPMVGLGDAITAPLGEAFLRLSGDEVLIAFTDGVVDAGKKLHGEALGRVGVLRAALSVDDRCARSIAKSVMDAAIERGLFDDATVLVIKMNKVPRGDSGYRDRE